MIKIRQLKEKDAPLMLEWMHDSVIQKCFRKSMLDYTIDDALEFIGKSEIPKEVKSGDNLHFAVVDEIDDCYLGTISLKNVDLENGTAEYAIVIRKAFHGKGIGFQATRLILEKAFYEIGLHRVYLSVYSNNVGAAKLYERCGFVCEGEFREHFLLNSKYVGWKWYGILKEEFDIKRFTE